MNVVPGLEVFLEREVRRFRGARIGLCCNPTAVDRRLDHALERLSAAGLRPARVFAPEHGALATAQDMVPVADEPLPVEVVSLYGESAESLRPPPGSLDGLDAVVLDIQDVGARYYTYQATMGYLMEAAAAAGCRFVVLDRPNPITGCHVEGNVVQPGYESFVSAWPLAVRHGMTMGELAGFLRVHLALDLDLEVVPCAGWRRGAWFDETGLPWVPPSPNMPTLETAILYPGACLVEGTNLSEGRGTTRPFHLVGAPWIAPERFVRLCRRGAEEAGLRGVGFRACRFLPQFQKHAGRVCGGVEIHLADREVLESFLLGLVVLEAAMRCDPDSFRWRTEPYEFVEDPIAIDLLTGSSEARLGLEARIPPRELVEGWAPALREWCERRAGFLLYS